MRPKKAREGKRRGENKEKEKVSIKSWLELGQKSQSSLGELSLQNILRSGKWFFTAVALVQVTEPYDS